MHGPVLNKGLKIKLPSPANGTHYVTIQKEKK